MLFSGSEEQSGVSDKRRGSEAFKYDDGELGTVKKGKERGGAQEEGLRSVTLFLFPVCFPPFYFITFLLYGFIIIILFFICVFLIILCVTLLCMKSSIQIKFDQFKTSQTQQFCDT